MKFKNCEIPSNATIRQEYVRCGNPDCQKLHGPYLYAYWKQDKKLKKSYVGKNLEDFAVRKIAMRKRFAFATAVVFAVAIIMITIPLNRFILPSTVCSTTTANK